jgi:glyoxylase-like metal-dependent hydrolase (beta-lactamase superfamily II)
MKWLCPNINIGQSMKNRLTCVIKHPIFHCSYPIKTFGYMLFIFHSLLLATPATADYAPVTVPMEVQKVSEHVYFVQGKAGIATDNEGFISNAGFIITGDGVVVFDSLGTPSLAAQLVKEIHKITKQPIKRVIASHYHADHIYGLQVFEDMGIKISAPEGAYTYLNSPAAKERLEERQFSLEPWVNENTHLVKPDEIISQSTTFKMGDVTFTINYQGKAHSDGDLAMLVEPDRVLFSGDIIFEGRIPYVGDADTKHWLSVMEKLETTGLKALVPGHGPASTDPAKTIALTRKYLAYLREKMGAAAENFIAFDEAYAKTDWSEFKDLPAFDEGNRINAYQVFLSMEAEMLKE